MRIAESLKEHEPITSLLSADEQLPILEMRIQKACSDGNERRVNDAIAKIDKIFQELSVEFQFMALQKRYERFPTEDNFLRIYEAILKNPVFVCKLPNYLRAREPITSQLSFDEQMPILEMRLQEAYGSGNEIEFNDTINKIDKILKSTKKFLSEKISHALKNLPIIFNYLSPKDRLDVVLQRLSTAAHQDASHEIIDTIVDILSLEPDLKSKLPQWLRRHTRVIGFFDPVEQAKAAWLKTPTEVDQIWPDLFWRAKSLCIFRAAKESINLLAHAPKIRGESDPLIQAALNILWAMFNPERREQAFLKAHDLIQNHVVLQAWLSTDPIDLTPLLPNCRPGVVGHCEGRPWLTEEDKHENLKQASRAFCPRLRGECELFNENSNDQKDARIYPNVNLDWSLWSLQELLTAAGVTPRVVGLRDPDEYVNKLAGWLNRLNDIRERMRCSECNEIMLANQEYAKRLAAYRATVFFCKSGAGHDQDVYLNHCWGCDAQIIDSRESKIKIGGYYLCMRCGSGPKFSDYYRQGDLCPACGQILQEEGGFQRRFHCLNCSHELFIPPINKLTGNPDPNIRRKLLLRELGNIRFGFQR